MKTFKEYAMTRGFALGSPDSVHPIASIGNMKPPKGKGSRDYRAVGLTANTDKTLYMKLLRKAMSTMPGSQKQKEIYHQAISQLSNNQWQRHPFSKHLKSDS